MHVSMVMMFALTGLGCQNTPASASDAVAVTGYQVGYAPISSNQGSAYSTGVYTNSFAGTPYPEIPTHLYTPYSQPHSVDWHAELHSTLYSFVFGHDPNVSSVREIEASVYGADAGP